MRIMFDGRLLDAGPSGVRDIALGLVTGLQALEAAGDVELIIARTAQRDSNGHQAGSDRILSERGFMELGLPLAALKARADRILIPRQTVPLSTVVPAVPFFHDIGFMRRPDLYPGEKRIELTTRLAARARHGLAVSDFTAGELAERKLGRSITALPIQAVHRFHWRPDENDRYVVCVAAQQPHKNLVRLVEAWSEADTSGARLVICGRRGKDSARLSAAIDRGPKVAKVSLSVGLDDVQYQELLERCWGYVQPSLYEGLCIPALDLAAAGVPMIVSSSANLGVVFAAAPEPQVFDPNSTASLVRSIEALLSDKEFRAASTAFNLSTVKQTDWTRVATNAVAAMR